MPEKNELMPRPWFADISEALGKDFEPDCRSAFTQILNIQGPQILANIFGPFAPSLLDGILDEEQIQTIMDSNPERVTNSEQAIGYFVKIVQGIATKCAERDKIEPPSDKIFSALEETVRTTIPAHTGTELVTIKEQPQVIEELSPSRQEEIHRSEAYYGVTEAVLSSEHLKIENRDGIQGVEIEAGGERHFVPLEHLWTLIDYSPIASNGIQEEPFQNEYRQQKVAKETEKKLNSANEEQKQQDLKDEWTGLILGIRREQIRHEVANFNQVQPRLDEERQALEQLSLEELRAKVIELYPQAPLVDMAEREEINQAYQTASERLKFHQVINKVLSSEDYDDTVVGMTNAIEKTGHKIYRNLRSEKAQIDPNKPEPIPVYAELQPVVEEFYQSICRALYQEALIAHYPATPDQLTKVKTIFQHALNDLMSGLENNSINLSGEDYEQKSPLNKISFAYGQLMRQMLRGIKDFHEVEPMVNAIVHEQLKLAIEKEQLVLRSHEGRRVEVNNISHNTAEGLAVFKHKMVNDLLPAVIYAQAIGKSLDDNNLTQSAEIWQQYWLDALNLPTASLRGLEDVPYSKLFHALPQTRQEVLAIHQKAKDDLPEIQEKRNHRKTVDEARHQITIDRQEIERLLNRVNQLHSEAQRRFTEAHQATLAAEQTQQETREKRNLFGKIINQDELARVRGAYLAVQAAESDAELNLKLVSNGRGVAEGPRHKISALRVRIGRSKDLISQLNFPSTPNQDIDFEPELDAHGQPIIDITDFKE